MKCRSCDCILNDFESTRTYDEGVYVDLCNDCFSKSNTSLEEFEFVEHIEDEDDEDDLPWFLQEQAG